MSAEFKGIMLCDRPAGPKKHKPSQRNGFHLGAPIPEPLGTNPVPKVFPRSAKPKIETALQKHKKWLAQLAEQETGKTLEATAKEEEEAAKKRHVTEAAVTMRKSILFGSTAEFFEELGRDVDGGGGGGGGDGPSDTQADDERIASNSQATVAPEEAPESRSPSPKRQPTVTWKPGKPKPAWALTAEAAAEADAAEAEALLRFAESLDFQDYLDDSSKRDLGTALKTLAELEREDELKKYPLKEQTVWTESFVQAVNALVSEERDGLGELPAAAKAAGAASVASSALRKAKSVASDGQSGWDSSTVVNAKVGGKKGDAGLEEAIAEDLLRENSNLRAVHSKASVAKMVEAAAAAQQLQNAHGPSTGPA